MKNGGPTDPDDDFQGEWYTAQGGSNSADNKLSHITACFTDDFESTTTTAGPTTTTEATTTTVADTFTTVTAGPSTTVTSTTVADPTTTVIGGPSTTASGPTTALPELPYTGGGGPLGSSTLFLIGLGVLLAGLALFFGSFAVESLALCSSWRVWGPDGGPKLTYRESVMCGRPCPSLGIGPGE